MMKLEALIDGVSAFMNEHECQNWRFGKPYDSGQSTLTTVWSAVLTWDDAPLEHRRICVREAWTLYGGMEHGVHEVLAQVWTAHGETWGTRQLANVADAAALRAFLQQHVPVGKVLAGLLADAARAREAEARAEAALVAATPAAGELTPLMARALARLGAALGPAHAGEARALEGRLRQRIIEAVRGAPFDASSASV